MTRTHAHLRLSRWPFPIVPDADFCTFLAARRTVQKEIHEMVENLARRDTSSIHLFWAWFGAGKTHCLRYLAHYAAKIAAKEENGRLATVYTEFPKGAKSFLDLYRSLLVAIDMDVLTEAYFDIAASTVSEHLQLVKRLKQAAPDLFAALHVLATGSEFQSGLAFRWLRSDPVPLAELKKIGIVQRMTTSEEATRSLASLVSLLDAAAKVKGRPGARLIWMIDEFQRIEKSGSRGLDDINAGLHSTFNACPNALTLVFSFSGRAEEKTPVFFSRELKDRIGRTKAVLLPPMANEDAIRFVREVLAQFRVGSNASAPFFPFSEASAKAIIGDIETRGELKPRSIMHAFNAVLQEADQLIEKKKLEAITVDFATKTLAEYTMADADDDEDADEHDNQ
jgi:hypothetical protein